MAIMKRILFILFIVTTLEARTQSVDTVLSDSDKLYGLSRFWQEANYNFAYFSNVPDLNWDSAYRVFIPQVLATRSVFEYYRVLQRFCALLKDGHTNVYFPDHINSKRARRSFGDIRLQIYNFGGKPVVVSTAAGTKDVVPVGSEITRVNNIPVEEYINREVRPFISQSAGYITEDWCADYLLDGFLGDTVRIHFRKPDGSLHNILLKREVKPDVQWQQSLPFTLFQLTWLPGRIAKIDLNSFNDPKIVDTFITALPELKKAKGIIIDLRRNGGGSSDHASSILSYFTGSDSIRGSKWWTREHRASYKAWGAWKAEKENLGDTSEWARKSREYFYGRVWYEGGQMTNPNTAPVADRMPLVPLTVLFGHSTASAAEDFLIMLDGLKGRAVTFGQRSFASTGQPLFFELPGGGSARICTKKDTYPDGRIFVGVGIKPDVEIEPTIEDYLKQKDPVLEKAEAYLRTLIK